MASTKQPPSAGIPESQAFVILNFYLEQPNGSYTMHQADCLVDSEIGGLKEDLHQQLGSPETQKWYYNNQLLENERRLLDYGIDGYDEQKIVVKK